VAARKVRRGKADSSRGKGRSRAAGDTKIPSRKTLLAGSLQPADVIPGELILAKPDIIAFEGRPVVELIVSNTGDRPIQVGSHCHFFEANRALRFDREKSYGFRLQIPAGTAARFEPGEEKRVTLVAIGGNRVAYGINGLVNGRLDDPQVKAAALTRATERGFPAGKKSG
jgi:urease beta subunit